ncbi:Trk system potassium transporter TrkA [Chloroflexota bacterium]
MYIIVAGAGVVGQHIASTLVEGKHEVTVIEQSGVVVEGVRSQLDVKTVIGNAATPKILREAEVGRADLIIAVTHSDETNMLICFLSKELGAARTVSRVRNPEYSGFFVTAAKSPSAARKVIRPKTLGVDLFINPEVEVADEIINTLCGYCAIPVSNFADGRIQIGEFKVEQKNVVNKPLKRIIFPEPCVVAAIVRDGNTIIPGDDEILKKDDHIYIVAAQEALDKLGEVVAKPQSPVGSVVVFGGGRIGKLVAEGLEKHSISVKVIENDLARSEEIAAELELTVVVQGDATDHDFLIEQGVSSADAFVATTENDELNILCALLAKNLGVPRTLVAINKTGYIPLAEAIGVDVTVSSLLLTAGKIAHFVLHGGAISANFIGGEELQAVEFVVSSAAGVAEKSLAEAGLPKEAVAGAIIHNGDIIIPPNDRIVRTGDHVIVISPLSVIPSVEKLFK